MAIDTLKLKLIVLLIALPLSALTSPAFADDTSTGNGSSSNATSSTGGPVVSSSSANPNSTTGDVNDANKGTASTIRANYFLRHPNAAHFGPTQLGGSDVVVNGQSTGPGMVVHSSSGPVQVWPKIVPTAMSSVPTFRDQAITKNLFQTFGYPVSDTQFQIIQRYNDNIMLEQMFDPERVMWLMSAMGNIQATNTANSAANLAQNQAVSAIQHIQVFLVNFTNEAADPGNMWHSIRNNLFVPMAILLLFLGAVVAQVVAIVAQGTSVLGNISPFDGIQRSVIAVFLIPFTQLVMSWGIDVSNSIAQSIPTAYFTQFGRDMYQDAMCSIKRAFPINSQNDMNAMAPYNPGTSASTGTIEGLDFDITGGWNPCMTTVATGTGVPDEAEQFTTAASRLMANAGNATLAMTWNVLCAFQTAYLYYLWCMGPIVAALWVWPMQQLRNALPSWIDGLITLCFWSLFWNTSVLLMACFYGINTNGNTGTMYVSALMLLSNLSVKFAFNFSGLTTSLGFMAEGMMMNAAGSASGAGAHRQGGAGGSPVPHSTGYGGAEGGLAHSGGAAYGSHFGHAGAAGFVPGGAAGGAEEASTTSVSGTVVPDSALSGAAAALGSGDNGSSPIGANGLEGVLAGTGFGSGLGSADHEATLAGGNWPILSPPAGGEFAVGGAGGAIDPAPSGAAAPGAFDTVAGSGGGLVAGGAVGDPRLLGAGGGNIDPVPVSSDSNYASGLGSAAHEATLAGGNLPPLNSPSAGELALGGASAAAAFSLAGDSAGNTPGILNPVDGQAISDTQLANFDPGAAPNTDFGDFGVQGVSSSLGLPIAGDDSLNAPPSVEGIPAVFGNPNLTNLPPISSDVAVDQALSPYANPASDPTFNIPNQQAAGIVPSAPSDQNLVAQVPSSVEQNYSVQQPVQYASVPDSSFSSGLPATPSSEPMLIIPTPILERPQTIVNETPAPRQEFVETHSQSSQAVAESAPTTHNEPTHVAAAPSVLQPPAPPLIHTAAAPPLQSQSHNTSAHDTAVHGAPADTFNEPSPAEPARQNGSLQQMFASLQQRNLRRKRRNPNDPNEPPPSSVV